MWPSLGHFEEIDTVLLTQSTHWATFLPYLNLFLPLLYNLLCQYHSNKILESPNKFLWPYLHCSASVVTYTTGIIPSLPVHPYSYRSYTRGFKGPRPSCSILSRVSKAPGQVAVFWAGFQRPQAKLQYHEQGCGIMSRVSYLISL